MLKAQKERCNLSGEDGYNDTLVPKFRVRPRLGNESLSWKQCEGLMASKWRKVSKRCMTRFSASELLGILFRLAFILLLYANFAPSLLRPVLKNGWRRPQNTQRKLSYNFALLRKQSCRYSTKRFRGRFKAEVWLARFVPTFNCVLCKWTNLPLEKSRAERKTLRESSWHCFRT